MKDLTKGNPFKLILLFALPVFIGNVFQQLYNMVDTVIVSKTISPAAFTGVGLTGPVNFLVLGFATGLTAGFSVRIAQRFGAEDWAGVRRAVGMCYLLCIILTVVLTAIAVPLTGPLLRLMKTPDKYFTYAYSYLFTVFCGIAAIMLYNMGAGILRAIGDSKTPLVFLVISAVLNVGLDFLFIVAFKLPYVGAALATVVSQLVSGIACLVYMLKRYPLLRISRRDLEWDWSLAGGHVAVGLPMALQFSITSIGCIIQQTALNSLSQSLDGVVTAYVAAAKIDGLATQTFPALGTAMATYAGQNCGAGRYDRVKKGAGVSMVYVLASAVFGLAFCLGLYRPLMSLFLDETANAQILAYGKRYLIFQSSTYVCLGVIFVFRNLLQGIGKSAVTMLSGVTELAGRALTAFVFVKYWSFTGCCLSNPTAWVAADIFLLVTYFIVMRKKGREDIRNEAAGNAELIEAEIAEAETGNEERASCTNCGHGNNCATPNK